MSQKEIILEFLREYGSILPAKMSGVIYKGEMFGSEISKRCREMRKAGLLESEPDPSQPKFERFYLRGIRKNV